MPLDVQLIQVENNSDAPVRTVILPDNALVLAIQSGNPVRELIHGKKVALPSIHLCGHLTHLKEYEREPGSRTTLVKFRPWNLGLYLNGIRETVDKNIDFNDLATVTDVSLETNQVSIRLLLETIFEHSSVDRSVLQAIGIIEQMKGQIRVDELANRVCNSRRNLERKFRDAVGLTPKEFIRNTRFNNALKLMSSSGSLTEASYEGGYYDQSHFINDFKSITGVSPESYARVIKPIQNWALAARAYH